MERIGILTSGGDGPGMNAAIRASVRAASGYGVRMVGYLDGYSGFVKGSFVELDDRAVGNIIQRGGTIIGTSRSKAFHDPEVRREAVEQMRTDGVEGLVVVGGDGSFRGALSLQDDLGVHIAGLPGTIDNDVWGTDETIGFDTAVNTALLAIDQLRDTGEATGMMFFVEVMGRTSGAIALHTAVAGGAAGVVVPEAKEEIGQVIQELRASIARGKRSHIVVVAEGDEAGGVFNVAQMVGAALEIQYRVVVLGHVQRGGRPTMRDRLVASEGGAMAVKGLVEGRSGFMIGRRGGKSIEVPLIDVVSNKHPPADVQLLKLAQQLSG